MPLIIPDLDAVIAAGGNSRSESESEDLEMSSWEHEYESGDEESDRMDDIEEEEGLVGGSRKKQSRKGRRRETDRSLGDRMVMDPPGSGVVMSEADKRAADAKVMRTIAINACFIGLWYTFSLMISIYNKWMFSPEHLNFKFPLFVTCLHMLVQFSLASLVLFAFPQFRPGNFSGSGHHHHHHAGGDSERSKQQAGEMTKWFYFTRIGPCGAATGLDIGLGNMSLKFISLAFYTMCKSSSLAFVLMFAFLFRLEKPTMMLVGIISIMTIGVIMMVASETKFVLIGFVLIITASALSGLRWALTQVLLVRNPATGNPFSTIFFLAPVMFLSILCVAVPVEGFGPLFTRFGELVHEWGFVGATGVVMFPGCIAFMMVASEFALLQRSSVVTLSICGIFKEVITITAAAIVFKDPLTPVNISGLMITIVSIGGYNVWKIQKMRIDAASGEEPVGGVTGAEYAPVSTTGENAEDALLPGGSSRTDVGGSDGDDDGRKTTRKVAGKKTKGKRKAGALAPKKKKKVEAAEGGGEDEDSAGAAAAAGAGRSSANASPPGGRLDVQGSSGSVRLRSGSVGVI
ncbi:triose-phosphate transporter family-domain-containing protein [Peziza echinospora]|nr:triose-phosphate transporter family-domain-containing protein [Peziza echinospora]